MEEVCIAWPPFVGAIETHNVVVLIFHPDAAHEAALAGVLFGTYCEYQAAHVTQKFAVREAEVVMLAVKVGSVRIDHPGEAQGPVLNLVKSLEAAQKAGLHTLFFQIVGAINSVVQIHSAEEVMVFHGHRAPLW